MIFLIISSAKWVLVLVCDLLAWPSVFLSVGPFRPRRQVWGVTQKQASEHGLRSVLCSLCAPAFPATLSRGKEPLQPVWLSPAS